jgi:predicted alpha/beta-hydrolase family hydrolase
MGLTAADGAPPDARREKLSIGVGASHEVSGLLALPRAARALLVLAHGAGAGMQHPSMQTVADGLAQRDIGTLRYQFPYMERGSRRPDPPAVCHATVQAAVAEASRIAPGVPLFAGGRSFGGRMTSQAQARTPLPHVRGLVFLAFPLHPAGKPASERAAHLGQIEVPMLFIQGTGDELAQLALLEPVVAGLGGRATLHLLQDADHSFHAPARSGRSDAEVSNEALDAISAWLRRLVGRPRK